MIAMQFGDLNLQTGGITVHDTDVFSPPANSIQAERLADADGAVIVKQQYEPKKITIDGTLRGTSLISLKALRDAFYIGITKKNQPLDVDEGDGVRRYLANYQNMTTSRTSTTMGFSVELLCPDGVGWDLASSALLTPNTFSTSTANLSITVGGSYKAEPLIKVTVNTVTGGTTKTITINNGTSLRGVAITRTWANGDVLEIDSLKKTIYVNNAAVDFRGQFPSWEPGVGTISYIDDFTTRSVTVRADYTRRWL